MQEMTNRFSEASIDLLHCISCFDPRNQFSNFNVDKLLHLAELYPEDFSDSDRMYLPNQLKSFLHDIRRDERFDRLEDLGSLAKKIKETMKERVFPLIYRMVELALLLPVATASVERAFSAMNIVKTDLRNKMGDEWLNDSLVVYIEREVFATIDNEAILNRFQNMDARRNQLSSSSTTNTSVA